MHYGHLVEADRTTQSPIPEKRVVNGPARNNKPEMSAVVHSNTP